MFYILPGVFFLLRSSTLCLLKVNTSVITGGYWRGVALHISLSAQTFVGESRGEVNWNLVFFLSVPLVVLHSHCSHSLSLHASLLRPVAIYSQLESIFYDCFGSVCNFGIPKKYRILSNEVDGGRFHVTVWVSLLIFFFILHVCNLKKLCLTQIKILVAWRLRLCYDLESVNLIPGFLLFSFVQFVWGNISVSLTAGV